MHAAKIAAAWEKQIKRGTPSTQLLRLIGSLPLIGAAGITAIIILPRVTYTLRWLRRRRRGGDQPPIDAFRPQDQPPAPDRREPQLDPQLAAAAAAAAAEASMRAPAGKIPDGSGLTGGGYAGERAGEYASIDGTEAAA